MPDQKQHSWTATYREKITGKTKGLKRSGEKKTTKGEKYRLKTTWRNKIAWRKKNRKRSKKQEVQRKFSIVGTA